MKEYTFLWEIENYSCCWHRNEEVLKSPNFFADGLKSTAWYLKVFPRGCEDESCIGLFLNRSAFDAGPDEVFLQFELSVLAANGSTLHEKPFAHRFRMGGGKGCTCFLKRNDVHLFRKGEYLSEDILRVQCKIWTPERNVQPVKQISARTLIRIEMISFLLVADGFSTLQPNQKKNMQVRSPSQRGLSLSSSLHYTADSLPSETIIVEITPTNKVLAKCKIYLVDKYGEQIECGGIDNRYAIRRKDFVHLTLKRRVILANREIYLPDGNLSLKCECIFSDGIEFEMIEGTSHKLPFLTFNQLNDDGPSKDGEESLNECPSALDDFKALYKNQFFTDIELKTKTKSFPAHKLVLCARSSVFHAMLTNDMKEKNTGCIQIDDLEDEIVQQLLLFLYSDHLENLQWESAIKLFYAGDKYAVKKLKAMCASFLVDNLCPSRASELLLLTDTHNESQLRKNVEDFILQHADEVFSSEEWENLMKANPLLASETMHLRYKRRRV